VVAVEASPTGQAEDASGNDMESIGLTQDGALVREAQGGNRVAFAQLVQTYDQAVLRLALRLTGSESDALDIHLEAFLKVYKKLDDFRFECSFATWIYRIVTNVCLDHLRKNRIRKRNGAIELNDDDALNQLSDDRPGNSTEQQLLGGELSAQILRALKRLTPCERIVFDLKHFHGLTLRNVSEILNTSEGSVKAIFFRATRKLRFQLSRYTERRRPSMKQCCDKGVNQGQKAKRCLVTTTLAANEDNPMSELGPATPDRIVIMEGNGLLQMTLQQLFSSEGYEVDLVPDGLVGLEMLRQRPPSAVIVDLQHPGPSSYDLCKKIANLIPGLPLVILGASSDVAEKVLLLETGADDYVTAPFNSLELVARLRAIIRRAPRIGLEDSCPDKAGCL
jgi:RNA polymerase sigma-70 factor, ECF subfamily